MHTKSFSMLAIKHTLIFLALCFLNGCATKENIVYRDVYKSVRCNQVMPLKPDNNGTFEAHKEIIKYYIKCESIAKICTGDSNASSN